MRRVLTGIDKQTVYLTSIGMRNLVIGGRIQTGKKPCGSLQICVLLRRQYLFPTTRNVSNGNEVIRLDHQRFMVRYCVGNSECYEQ
jgi:hypothetical protein